MREWHEIYDELRVMDGLYPDHHTDEVFEKVEKENRKSFGATHLVAVTSIERREGVLIVGVASEADAYLSLVFPALKERVFFTQLKELLEVENASVEELPEHLTAKLEAEREAAQERYRQLELRNAEGKVKQIVHEALHQGQDPQRWHRPDTFKVDESVVDKTVERILKVLQEEENKDG